MKKLKVLGVAAIAAGMFSLTSCLDGGGNTQQLSSYAIVDYSSTMRTLIYPLGYYPLYVATIANDPTYSAGDCVLANFTVDFDSADNANASTNGFYVATGAASSPLAEYDLNYSPLDSMALDNELLLSGSESALLFSNNYKKIVVIPTFAAGIIASIPSTIPRPARRIGTTASFFPASSFAVIFVIGVSISTSSSFRSLVAS